MLQFLSKILFYFSSFSILPPPKKEQLEIMAWAEKKHQNASDFLKNSLRQYSCHTKYFLKPIWLGFNLFSIFAIVPLLLVLVLRSLKQVLPRKTKHISLYSKIPKDIREKFAPVFVKKPMGYLKPRDWNYVLQIFFYGRLRPYFLFRSIWKMAVYSELIDTYQPERIWTTQEMVFESSFLTAYLESQGLEHVNFMHGENYFSIQVAFSGFTEFYVWDEYYANLFRSLKVSAKKFVVFSALERTDSPLVQKNILKYYNQDSRNAKRFNLILDNLIAFARQKNCELQVRLHPLHKMVYEIEALKSRNIPLEDNSIDIVDSITESTYVSSEFSSVLYIASLLNRKIVIDNTFQERIDLIKDLDPIFIKKLPHEFLVQRS